MSWGDASAGHPWNLGIKKIGDWGSAGIGDKNSGWDQDSGLDKRNSGLGRRLTIAQYELIIIILRIILLRARVCTVKYYCNTIDTVMEFSLA